MKTILVGFCLLFSLVSSAEITVEPLYEESPEYADSPFYFDTPETVSTPVQVTVPVATNKNYLEEISQIAEKSACKQYSWKDRGRAPVGYIKGMALSYGRSLCKLNDQKSSPTLVASASPTQVMFSAMDTHKRDALSHYRSTFQQNRINFRPTDEKEVLRSVYTLGVGLGMRESSGRYCEGWDVAGPKKEVSAEAGLFQTSYDSMGANPALRSLYEEYKANPDRCFADAYKDGVKCKPKRNSIPIGNGKGAEFQRFNKDCPAFATEYVMVMLRVQRNHYGPIKRLKAEVKSDCFEMFKSVESLINSDEAGACAQLR